MTVELLAVFIPVVSLAALVAGHILSYRLTPSLGALVAGFLLGFLTFLVLEGLVLQEMSWSGFSDGAANLAAYLALAYAYFHFVNMSRTARRIRILHETAQSLDGLSREDLHSLYNAREMIDRRLARLLDAGQIHEGDGRLRTGNRAMWGMHLIMTFFKRLLFPGH